MDYLATTLEEIVQLSRLSLAGRVQDVKAYIGRLARRHRRTHPETAERLVRLLADNPTPAAPVRGAGMAVVPVDTDSRLQLLRIDHAPQLDHRPVWAPPVAERLEALVAEHRAGEILAAAGLWPTRTAVFTGPPGVGKTLAARWLAAELGLPLMTLDLSAVISSFLGRTGANLRHVLDYAKGVRCVLLLDEVDAIAKRRDDLHEVGELKRLVTVLLQEIDDWPAGGLLVAATNHPDLLDPAVWRRFEAAVEFPLPDAAGAEQLIREVLSDAEPRSAGLLARVFAGRSFSDIHRHLTAARKAAVLSGGGLEGPLMAVVRENCRLLTKAALKRVALDLLAAGVSARQVSDWTGLSRDTIRKAAGGRAGQGEVADA